MKNHGGIPPSIMAGERSNGAPGGAPVRPIPPTGRPYSSIRATGMCTKALRRGKLIGIVLEDEFTIALGDNTGILMDKTTEKLPLVAGGSTPDKSPERRRP